MWSDCGVSVKYLKGELSRYSHMYISAYGGAEKASGQNYYSYWLFNLYLKDKGPDQD